MMVVALRWFIVVTLLVVFSRKNLVRDWVSLKPQLGFLFLMGAIGFSVFNGMFFLAAQYTSAINMGIITAMMPVFVLIGAIAAYGTPTRKLQWVGAVVTLVGVVVVASHGEIDRLLEFRLNTGDLILIVATIVYAAYTVGLRRRPNSSALGLFTVLAASALIASLPMVAAEVWLGEVQMPTQRGWGLILLVALFPTLLAQIMFIRGVEIIGPGRAGIFVNLVPVFGTAIAVLYLGEQFEGFHALALALVLVGIWLAERNVTPAPVESVK